MKNAIVTGATRGIGLATAEMLLKEGYHVTVTYAYDEPSVEPCKARLSAISNAYEIVWADQTNKQEMRDFASKMREKGHIDCIVCNAGSGEKPGEVLRGDGNNGQRHRPWLRGDGMAERQAIGNQKQHLQ